LCASNLFCKFLMLSFADHRMLTPEYFPAPPIGSPETASTSGTPPWVGMVADALEIAVTSAGGARGARPSCFVAGTLVMTETGQRAIEQLRAGDVVLGKDELNGELGWHVVVEVHQRQSADVLEVVTVNEIGSATTMRVTIEHPVFVADVGFVRAVDLVVGDRLATSNGRTVDVVAISSLHDDAAVYNLTVDGAESYFVGEDGIWSHNKGRKRPTPLERSLAPKAPKQGKPGETIRGTYVDKDGNSHEWTASYDQYGRLMERTDFTGQPNPNTHTDPHHHNITYGPGENGTDSGPLPGAGPTTGQ
jgi:YD repeat-containing protein